MTVLENHLRLTRRQCAEQRRHLDGLELLAVRLRADATRLRREIEHAAAGPSPADHNVNHTLAWPLIQRHGKLERSIADLDEQIIAAHAGLAAVERLLQRHERASTHLSASAQNRFKNRI